MQACAGSPYPVLGLSVPELRSILRSFANVHPRLMAAEVNALAGALWSGPTYEEKAMAIALMSRYRKALDDTSWALAGQWVDDATGWALSNGLASGPIAAMVYARPARFRDVMGWTRADHFWRRRAATYAMRDFVFSGELERPFRLLQRLLFDTEFWVQRAVGTWLRECWKQDHRRTEAFLRRNVRGLPPVVISVATERAPKTFREELRRRRGASTPLARRGDARRVRPVGRSRRKSRASPRRRPSR